MPSVRIASCPSTGGSQAWRSSRLTGWLTSLFVAVRRLRKEQRVHTEPECRAQAERVSAWPGPSSDPQPVALLNHSDEPVYEAVATFVFIDGSGPARGEEVTPELAARRVRVGVIPPGRWRVCVDGEWNGMYSRLGLEVAFTDRAGVHWVRRVDGRLEQIPQGAFDYFASVSPAGPDAARAVRRPEGRGSVIERVSIPSPSATGSAGAGRPAVHAAGSPRPPATPPRATSSPATIGRVVDRWRGARTPRPPAPPPEHAPNRAASSPDDGAVSRRRRRRNASCYTYDSLSISARRRALVALI